MSHNIFKFVLATIGLTTKTAKSEQSYKLPFFKINNFPQNQK